MSKFSALIGRGIVKSLSWMRKPSVCGFMLGAASVGSTVAAGLKSSEVEALKVMAESKPDFGPIGTYLSLHRTIIEDLIKSLRDENKENKKLWGQIADNQTLIRFRQADLEKSIRGLKQISTPVLTVSTKPVDNPGFMRVNFYSREGDKEIGSPVMYGIFKHLKANEQYKLMELIKKNYPVNNNVITIKGWDDTIKFIGDITKYLIEVVGETRANEIIDSFKYE